MAHPLVEYYRCPEDVAVLRTAEGLSENAGYFRVGDAVSYGRAAGYVAPRSDAVLPDLAATASAANDQATLPFDLGEAVANLRHERYPEAQRAIADLVAPSLVRPLYYLVRPILPVYVRKHLQRLHWRGWEHITFPRWPVDVSVESLMRMAAGFALASGRITEFPFIWFWPDGAQGCAMMTHDVEGPPGIRFCDRLMDMDEAFGIPSSFQVVPEAPWAARGATRRLVDRLRDRGFEVNVHDLSHDGRLFRSRETFVRHAAAINACGREFGSRGFRSGAMYRRQDWLPALDICYDMSVPNVAHLEPQRGGCCTVMPYFNGHVLELPLTTGQDYTVFHVIGEYTTALWEEQIERILDENGLVSFITHPDYLVERRALDVYTALLKRLVDLGSEQHVWLAPPAAIDGWWRDRRDMSLVHERGAWQVRGPGSERAQVAWARLDGDRVVYDVRSRRRVA